MVLLTTYNLLIESVESHRSECVLSHLQSGCFFDSDLDHLFSRNESIIDRRIKQYLSVPCIFPSIQSVVPSYAPSTALSVCRDSTAGVYHDLETGKCISRISRTVYTKPHTEDIAGLASTCTNVAAAQDSGSPLVFLGNASGDINVIDLRVGVKGEFGHPVMSLGACHTGAISCMYNFRGFSFSLASGGFEDGRLNFFDLRYPYDHLKNPYSERPMALRTFEMHLRNQTKYADMDEGDQQILKHMKIGRINSMAVSNDEKLLAISNGQSEVVICSVNEDIRVAKMGFLSSKDDYATSLAFSEHDTHLFCSTYDLLAGIAHCKSRLNNMGGQFPGTQPFNIVAWPLLNFQSNDWITKPINKFGYHESYQLLEDFSNGSLFSGDLCKYSQVSTDVEDNHRVGDAHNPKEPSLGRDRSNGKGASEYGNNSNSGAYLSGLRMVSRRKAEACHRWYRKMPARKIRPLIFTLVGDYAVSTGGYETHNHTIDVWDPLKQELLASSSTPESRKVRFENICSGKDGTVLLSGTFERPSTLESMKSDIGCYLLNKAVCVMRKVTRDYLTSANASSQLQCSFI